jgi:hypothetical protein
MQTHVINFPHGPADQQSIEDAAVPDTLTISNAYTILKKAGGFAQAVTALSLLAAPGLLIGSRVVIRIEQNATGRNVAFGAAGSTITAPNLTGVASDKDVIVLYWDGSAFIAETAWNKVHDAA